MGKYHEAVAKGGDFWRAYLDEGLWSANARNATFADSSMFDRLSISLGTKFTKVNGGGYSDANVGRFYEYLAHCVI